MTLPEIKIMRLIPAPKLIFYEESKSLTNEVNEVCYVTKFYFSLGDIVAFEALDTSLDTDYDDLKDIYKEVTLLYLHGCVDPHIICLTVDDFISLIEDNQDKSTLKQWPLSTN